MRLVRLERQQSRVADDIRAALASLGRGSTVIGGIALIGVGAVADRPIEAVVLLPHGVIIVIGVDLPDPALRLEAPLGAEWRADGWPLVADDDAVNPATEALDVSQACERKIAALVPGTAPVGTIIAVGPYVETVDQPAGDLAGPVRVLHPTPTTMLAATVSLATAHRPRSVDQVRALIRGLAPDAPEFSDDILVGEGFSRFTDDSPPESLWDSGPEVPAQAATSPASAAAAASAPAGGSDWRTETPVPPHPKPVAEPPAEPERAPAGATVAEPPAEAAPQPELPHTAEPAPTDTTAAEPPTESAPATAEPPAPAKPATAEPPAPAKPATAEPPAPAKPATAEPPAPAKPATAEPPAPAKPATAEPPAAIAPAELTAARPSEATGPAPEPNPPATSETTPAEQPPAATGRVPDLPATSAAAPAVQPPAETEPAPEADLPAAAASAEPTPAGTGPAPQPERPAATDSAPATPAPEPKLPLAAEISLPQVAPTPETERTEVLPAPPAFPGTEAPRSTHSSEPGPSTTDTERTETLEPDAARTERFPTTPRPERAAPPPQPPARQPIQPAAPQPFPRPRPEPEGSSRTVRWLPLGAIGLLVLLVVAAIAVATTGDDTAAAPTGPPTPATQPPPASATSAAPAQSLQFALRAADADQRCASHAFGDAQASLQQTSCSGVRRASYATTVDGRPGAVTVGIVEFPDAAQAAAFKAVADTPGGGGILDLATETGKWGETALPRFENAAYASKVEGTSVRLVQAVWAPGPSTPDDPGLTRAAKAALDLPTQ
ncbi:hypothetical protein [Amycolatopsis sp. cg9]|uniref:hypothetical protein n=1 Tax=Amycolatopsis sp. cg9 TaxID=3238801 RepID=UPI0035242242